MPTIVYTPDEQAQINAAQKLIDNANAALTTAFNLRESEWSESPNRPTNSTGYGVLSWLDEVQKCNPLTSFTRDNIGNPIVKIPGGLKADCTAANGANTAMSQYQNYQNQYITAQTNLKNATTNYDTIKNGFTGVPDVSTQLSTNNILAQGIAKTKTSKWLVFGIITVAVIIFVAFMLKTKSA